MPTTLRDGPYRFYFYSADGTEPPHIHVGRDKLEAKYWLDPVEYESSTGFKKKELRTIEKIIEENRDALLEAWNEHFEE